VYECDLRMKLSLVSQIVVLTAGYGVLLLGLFLLDREPIIGVLGMLGAMALVLWALSSSTKAEAVQELRCVITNQENSDGR
jgi:hypothetical protein